MGTRVGAALFLCARRSGNLTRLGHPRPLLCCGRPQAVTPVQNLQRRFLSQQQLPHTQVGWYRRQGQRLKETIRTYGPVGVGLYSSVYVCVLGGTYVAVSAGVDMHSLLEKLGMGHRLDALDGAAGSFLVAYFLTALTGPLRMGLVAAATPPLHRALQPHFHRLEPIKKVWTKWTGRGR